MVAYFLPVFALCLLVFVLVMVQLARIKRQNPHNQCPSRGVLADVRSVTGLAVLLGLTWGLALFAWGPLFLPFVYLFSIFNSLQGAAQFLGQERRRHKGSSSFCFSGFLVFVFHCAGKENVRRQWRTHLCCGRLRPVEVSGERLHVSRVSGMRSQKQDHQSRHWTGDWKRVANVMCTLGQNGVGGTGTHLQPPPRGLLASRHGAPPS